MRIGILGTGNMGSGLGRHLAAAGHDVFVGSRDAERGKEAGHDIGASGGTYRDAVDHGDVVILAVPWRGVDETLAGAGDLGGKVLIDVTNPYNPDYTAMQRWADSSGAEQIAAKCGARVVKAFNHLYAPVVHSGPDFGGQAASVLLCGDDDAAKETVAGLARDLGYDPVDCGGLDMAAHIESVAALAVTIAYGLGRGPNQVFKIISR